MDEVPKSNGNEVIRILGGIPKWMILESKFQDKEETIYRLLQHYHQACDKKRRRNDFLLISALVLLVEGLLLLGFVRYKAPPEFTVMILLTLAPLMIWLSLMSLMINSQLWHHVFLSEDEDNFLNAAEIITRSMPGITAFSERKVIEKAINNYLYALGCDIVRSESSLIPENDALVESREEFSNLYAAAVYVGIDLRPKEYFFPKASSAASG